MSNTSDKEMVTKVWEQAKAREEAEVKEKEAKILARKNQQRKILGISIIVLGVLSGLLFFRAGWKLSYEGRQLTTLSSVSGTSVAESYYQSMGEYGLAYSIICYAFGFGIIAISLGFGGRFLFDKESL